MIRFAKARWFGGLKHGRGFIVSESGKLSNLTFSFDERFEDSMGFSPEEMIAAAHSSCLSMAITAELEKRRITPTTVDVSSGVSFENLANSWTIPEVELKVKIVAIGANSRLVEEAANVAKVNCPVSKLLRTSIHMQLDIFTEISTSTSSKNDVESSL